MDIIMAKKYFVPALLDIAKKYEFDIVQNIQADDNHIVITLHSRKLQKEEASDFYHIKLWRFGIENEPPYRIRIVLFRGQDRFDLSPDIVNEIDVETLYHIVSYLDSKFCQSASSQERRIEMNKIELLIDFQNFLILDGHLDLDPDEVKRNAEIFCNENPMPRLTTFEEFEKSADVKED